MTSAETNGTRVTSAFARVLARLRVDPQAARVVLAAFVILIACPVRYWPVAPGFDPTWQFALNYAAANGYVIGRDYAYTVGPLAYLILPSHLGGNLEQGLLFQAAMWLVWAVIIVDVFFRAGFGVRSLAVFSLCFSLAAPWFWFNFLGPENLMLAGALLLLVVAHTRGGWIRYVSALILIGFLPLLKLTAGVIGLSALAGYLAEHLLERRRMVWRELFAAAVVPICVAVGVGLLFVPSPSALARFARGGAEVMAGYSASMSIPGDRYEILLAVEALAVLLAMLVLHATTSRALARFYVLLLAGPVFFSVKHGFVRQDYHVVNFFCFIALALGLVLLTVRGEAVKGRVLPGLFVFAVIWQQPLYNHYEWSAFSFASGTAAVRMLSGVFTVRRLRRDLDSAAVNFPKSSRLEPEVVALIGDSSVAALSGDFTNVFAAGLRLTLYPSLQRAVAYTPFLDRWNAAWVREKGPRFLLFDGQSIDERDAWAETPAMWLDVYRWYDTRLLGTRTLVLERRQTPRFSTLETVRHLRLNVSEDLEIPASEVPIFWTLHCRPSLSGSIRKLLTRSPDVSIAVHETGGDWRSARALPDVLVSPVLGNFLPANLAQFAAVFTPGRQPGFSVDRIRVGEMGGDALASPCEAELLRTVN